MILLIKSSIIGIKATLGRVPIALRPSLVYIILMLVSVIPMRLLHFPVESIGSMIQFGLPILMYFILAPVLAAMSIRQEELSRGEPSCLDCSWRDAVFMYSNQPISVLRLLGEPVFHFLGHSCNCNSFCCDCCGDLNKD